MISIIPVADYILFRRDEIKTASGIIVAGNKSSADGVCKNVVIAKGKKADRVEVGDEIMVEPQTAMKVNYPERNIEAGLFLVKNEHIVAKISTK